LIAINTVKRWVPETTIMSDMVVKFATTTFSKLTHSNNANSNGDNHAVTPVTYAYLPEITTPANQEAVQQYVELLFALSVREPRLLNE
jgi:flagellar basal body-associated protein FliL